MNTYLKGVSIMIVDDLEFSVQILREMVRVLGAQDIRTFLDGEMAWRDFIVRPADLIIIDWEMQPVSGIELTKRIRKHPDSPNTFVPIIMVTAHRERDEVFRARDSGVTEYVVKPVSPKALFSRIEAVIERPRRFVRVGEFFGPDRRRHNAQFDGEDRRGKEAAAPAKKAAPKSHEMEQEEINNTFNPNDAPREEEKKREDAD